MPVGLNAFKRRTRSGLVLPSTGGSGLISTAASGPALDVAILALSPLSYWTLRGNDANTLKDFGSLAHDLTAFGSPTLANTAGGDGFSYPTYTSSGSYFQAVDDIGYEFANAGGLTVIRLVRSPTGGTGGFILHEMGKWDSTGGGTWRMAYGVVAGSTTNSAAILTSSGDARRSRVAGATADKWELFITRFSSSTTAFPAIRQSGVNMTITTNGTGTGQSNSTQAVILGGHNGSTSRFLGGHHAHVAIVAGQLTDPQCVTIESAATADGWTI